MNNSINIRIANSSDMTRLLDWGKKLYLVEKQFEPLMLFSPQETKERYTRQIDDPTCLFLIVEYDDKPAGYLYAHLDKIPYLDTIKKVCYLEVIYLEPDFRQKGISAFLIDKCTAWAKQNNALRIKTDIFTNNQASIKSFEKSGFHQSNITYIKNL